MPFIKRGVYERLRFHSETTAQHYILADITAVCSSFTWVTILLAYNEILLLTCLAADYIGILLTNCIALFNCNYICLGTINKHIFVASTSTVG